MRTIISIILIPAITGLQLIGTLNSGNIRFTRSTPTNLSPALAVDTDSLNQEYASRYQARASANATGQQKTSVPNEPVIFSPLFTPLLRAAFDIPQHVKTWVYATAIIVVCVVIPCVIAIDTHDGSKNPFKHIVFSYSVVLAASPGKKMSRPQTKTTPLVKKDPPFNPNRIHSTEVLLRIIRSSATAYMVSDTDTWEGIAKKAGTTFSTSQVNAGRLITRVRMVSRITKTTAPRNSTIACVSFNRRRTIKNTKVTRKRSRTLNQVSL